MLLGQNSLGKFGLGDFGSNPKVTLSGVFGTGVAGSIFPSTGAIPAVFGTGAVGTLRASTLNVNPHRLLANVLRRLRTIGRSVANPKV